MTTIIDAFKAHWNHIHDMTSQFAAVVPDTAWDNSPHPGFAAFSKQLRHVVCVRGVYNEGLTSGKADFSRKHEYYSGHLHRENLASALEEKQSDLITILEDADRLEGPTFTIDLMGAHLGFAEYTYVMVQHEAIHHGEWSLYAAQSGFPVPPLWTIQWGLGPWTKA